MGSVRRYVDIYSAIAAGTGDWVPLDTRYEKTPEGRALRVQLTAGDTITLQAITKDVKGIDKSFLTSLLAQDISTLKTYTQSETDLLDGNWTYIRAVKTGTAGIGIISGVV